MKRMIHVDMYKGDEYYIAECIDLPVVTQGKTLDELVGTATGFLQPRTELNLTR